MITIEDNVSVTIKQTPEGLLVLTLGDTRQPELPPTPAVEEPKRAIRKRGMYTKGSKGIVDSKGEKKWLKGVLSNGKRYYYRNENFSEETAVVPLAKLGQKEQE